MSSEPCPGPEEPPQLPRGIRWWPAAALVLLAATAILAGRARGDLSFQQKNLWTLAVLAVLCGLLFLWWLTFSRVGWKLRLTAAALIVGVAGLGAALFRIRGVSGDLIPILEPRWAGTLGALPAGETNTAGTGARRPALEASRPDFPQFLGPHRDAVLEAPSLRRDWATHPPKVVWRRKVGAAWSGWAIVGNRALTQEQRAEEECVTCYEASTGRLLWAHADPAHYHTTIAGEGPRCTPTVVSNRVFALGATGLLNALDLADGKRLWSHDIAADARTHAPEWGFAGSPLVADGLVIVIAGGSSNRSVLAYRVDNGELAWSGGNAPASYSSPLRTVLAGVPQVLAFNSRRIVAHDVQTGRVLWESPWGTGQPQVAVPLVVGPDRVVFSSGYGVGSELLEVRAGPDGRLAATRLWQSKRMKAKFATLVQRDGFLYGLDDGILACLDLKDGTQKWKEGRYGHGQGLLVRDLYLLMAEDGELVLIQPRPDSLHELGRFRVFRAKSWNPIALAGDLLLVRTDQEAAGLQLEVETPEP